MNISDVVIDPDLEAFLPPHSEQEKAAFQESIEQDGWTDPITVWLGFGAIVDGHHRYRLWQEKGSDPDNCPEIVERKFTDKAAAMAWMFRRQTARRNWTPAQRAAVALKMKPAIEQRAKENEKAGGGDKKSKKQSGKSGSMNSSNPIQPVDTRKEIAAIAGVSEDTVRKTEVVIKEGSPETVKALESGEITANAAFKETRKSQFNPSEFDDGPERTNPATEKQIKKAASVLARLTGDFGRVADGMAPLVCTFDEIKAADASFGRRHKELLGHHSRLFEIIEDGKKVLNALNAAWVRK